MKRDLYIKRLKEHILHKEGRPFSEVESYAEEIGAHFEELEEAIAQIAKEKNLDLPIKNLEIKYDLAEDVDTQQTPSSSPPSKRHIKKRALVFAGIATAVVFLFGALMVLNPSKSSPLQAQNASQVVHDVATKAASLVPEVGIVYANKEHIDPQRARLLYKELCLFFRALQASSKGKSLTPLFWECRYI